MSQEPESRDPETDVDAVAAEWLVRLREASLRDSAELQIEFARWRDIDQGHAEAFERISKTWDAIGAHAETPEIVALRREAREELERNANHQQSRKKWGRWATIGGIDVAAAAALAYMFFWPPAAQLITTGIGQTKIEHLQDGSRVEIDADSAVSVEFSRKTRFVRLLKGQAYFEVAKNQLRPFVVADNGRSVVATGTAFDVESLSAGLHVTLVEGRVLVRESSGVDGRVVATLTPGDSLTTAAGAPDRLQHRSNLLALLAWRTGHLMFDDVTLADAVKTMSRYVHQRIAVDPSIGSFRISGVFAAGDMRGLLEAVEAYYPVAERPERDGGIRLTHRS